MAKNRVSYQTCSSELPCFIHFAKVAIPLVCFQIMTWDCRQTFAANGQNIVIHFDDCRTRSLNVHILSAAHLIVSIVKLNYQLSALSSILFELEDFKWIYWDRLPVDVRDIFVDGRDKVYFAVGGHGYNFNLYRISRLRVSEEVRLRHYDPPLNPAGSNVVKPFAN